MKVRPLKISAIPGHRLFFASLALPLLLWYVSAVYGMGLPPAEAVDVAAFRIFYALLFVPVIIELVASLQRKTFHRLLVAAGLLLLLAQGVLHYGFRFSGTIALGENEPFEGYHKVDAGVWVRNTPVPIALAKVTDDAGKKFIIYLNGRQKKLALNEPFSWQGLRLRITEQRTAPLFFVDTAKGEQVDAANIKLGLVAAERDFFQMGLLPHRFYIGPATEKGTAESPVPDSLHLKIVRDKLVIFDEDISKKVPLFFEGHSIKYEDGTPWVVIRAERFRTPYALYLGLLLVFAGALSRRRIAGRKDETAS